MCYLLIGWSLTMIKYIETDNCEFHNIKIKICYFQNIFFKFSARYGCPDPENFKKRQQYDLKKNGLKCSAEPQKKI